MIGNLDEKVTDRILYEILIQVGRVVDLYMPMDREANRHKGYAFAEYESEEIANYAVRLFSGLVCLHNRTLRFSVRLCSPSPSPSDLCHFSEGRSSGSTGCSPPQIFHFWPV